MTSDSAESIANEARKLPGISERETLIDRTCGDDQELRSRVERLLATTAEDVELNFGDDLHSEKAGDVIGRYRLVREVGQGGFGTVWLADQEQPVKRQVALKIIKLGMDTRHVVARFEQERQALALMDHPGIARVLDAGATITGRPYFVMDYVPGEAIAEFCDKNELSIRARLELCAQVCAAVQHAHGKGVIHRDLKPSNILVAMQDGVPRAKVIDFGVAKATWSKLTDKTLQTAHQQVIGTLRYMSPEQAEGSLDIDTRTDVYSIGVVLYELLTGSTPFDRRAAKTLTPYELHRLIRESEPDSPSTRLEASTAGIQSIAARRGVGAGRLGSIVRGELDWIVMKAIEKDRARRYETANGFALDIRRYLAGEAVLAAPPSALYRFRKLVRRNKSAVVAAAAVTASLIVGVVGFAWQATVAASERDAAVVAREREAKSRVLAEQLGESEARQRVIAESNEQKAAVINKFLLEMLGSADIRNRGRDVKVADVLDSAAADVETAFKARPEVEAAVRQILGKTYLSLGLLDRGEPQVMASLETTKAVYGEESVEYARALSSLGYLLGQRGLHEKAIEPYERAFATAMRVAGPEATVTLGIEGDYANALSRVNRSAEAERLFRETIRIRRAQPGVDTRDAVVAINSLAVLLHGLGRLDEAEALYRESMDLGTEVLGAEQADTLTAKMNLGSILRTRGKLADAESLMVSAYASIRKVFGDRHTKTAQCAGVLAGLYFDQGRMKDAVPLAEEALAVRRKAEGDGTAGVASDELELGMMLSRVAQYDRAVALLRDAVKTMTVVFGPETKETLNARLDLANTLVAAGRGADAESVFLELIVVVPRALGESSPVTIIATNSYAVYLLSQERYADAEPYLRKALDLGRRVEGADARNTVITQYNLSAALREMGHLGDAETEGRELIDRFSKAFGARHANMATARSGYAETLIKLDRKDEAKRELREALAIVRESLGESHPSLASYSCTLGRLLVDTGDLDEAESVLRDAVALGIRARGANDRRTAMARVELGRCLTKLNQFTEAETLLTEGQAVLKTARPGSTDLARAEGFLADLYDAWNAAEPDVTRAAKAGDWRKAQTATQAAAASRPAMKP